MIEVTLKPALLAKTKQGTEQKDKRGRKKQSIFGQQRKRNKQGAGQAKTGAVVPNISASQIFHKKSAIISHADWSKAKKRLLREEEERNRDSSNPSFYFGANAKLGELFRRAKNGDVDAARMLLLCLTYNVGEFEKFCSSKTRIAKRIVVVGEPWPLLHTDLKANKDGALTIPPHHVLRKLGVVRGKRRYNITTSVGTAVAATLYNQMEFYRHTLRQTLLDKREIALDAAIDRIRRLKPLSPSNYGAWWKAAEPLFIRQWGKEFQDDPYFKKWRTAAYKGLEPHVAGSAKRRDIKRAIKEGFQSLANTLRDRVPD
jgi:hypothetical protein